MTVEHIAMVLAAGGLDGSEKLQLVALANRTDEHGYCWPSIERQAEDTGTSISTTRRILRRLEQKNLVKSMARYDSTGRQIQNLYRLNLALLASMRRAPRDYKDNVVEQITFDAPPAPRGEGVNLTGGGGQSDIPGGVNLTPKPSEEPSEEPSSSSSSSSSARPAATQEEEEEERKPADAGLRDRAAQLLDAVRWPLGGRPSPVDHGRLVTWAARCLAAGHPDADVARELREAMSAQRPVGAAIARLRALVAMPPRQAAAGEASDTVPPTSPARREWELPPCEHDVPGGHMHLASGVLRCPMCRRAARRRGDAPGTGDVAEPPKLAALMAQVAAGASQ